MTSYPTVGEAIAFHARLIAKFKGVAWVPGSWRTRVRFGETTEWVRRALLLQISYSVRSEPEPSISGSRIVLYNPTD